MKTYISTTVIGFDRTDNTTSLCAVDDGIFYWDEASLKETNRLQAYDCETLHEKQLLMVGYCLELGYDLMIHPDNNVYRMLGFGYCLGSRLAKLAQKITSLFVTKNRSNSSNFSVCCWWLACTHSAFFV